MPPRLHLDLARWKKDPRVRVRVALAVLLLANLVAALVAFKPWASSVDDLERQEAALRQQVRQREAAIDRMRTLVNKVESARADGDRFMDQYLLATRSMSSMLGLELEQMARKAGIQQKDTAFSYEQVEGADTLTKATITAGYEGTYADLMHFLNLLDHSERFLIVESLGAAPQQSGTGLGITMKLSAFVREGGEPPLEAADLQLPPESPAHAAAPPRPQAAAPPPPALVAAPPPSAPPPGRQPPWLTRGNRPNR